MILDIVNYLLLHVEVKKKVSTRGGPGFLERGWGKLQYVMILDIVNNLLLHVEVKKKVSTRGGPGFLERG